MEKTHRERVLEETPYSQLYLREYYPYPMRVLLQNTETKLYFIDADDWTDEPSKATDFEDVDNAAQVYHVQNLVYARIVVEPGPIAQKPRSLGELLKYVQAQG